MASARAETIRKNYVLLGDVEPDDVIPHLYQEKVIPNQDRVEDITSKTEKKQRTQLLLRQISNSDNPNSIPIFITALEEKGYTHIAEKVLDTWEDLKNNELTNNACNLDNSDIGFIDDEYTDDTKRCSGSSSASSASRAEVGTRLSSTGMPSDVDFDTVDANLDFGEDNRANNGAFRTVTLYRGRKGEFGFHVVSGSERPRHEGDCEFYITHINPELEEEDKDIRVKDTIITVNGQLAQRFSKRELHEFVGKCSEVQLELDRYQSHK